MQYLAQTSSFALAALLAGTAAAAPFTTTATNQDLNPRTLCSEAGRFGQFSVTPTSNLALNQPFTITYNQNCPDLADVKPTQLTMIIGGQDGFPILYLGEVSLAPGQYSVEYQATVPDAYLPDNKGDNLTIAGIISYPQLGPSNTNTTHLYEFQVPFSIDTGSSS